MAADANDAGVEWVLAELIEVGDCIWNPRGVDSGTVERVHEDPDGYFFERWDKAPTLRFERGEQVKRRIRDW